MAQGASLHVSQCDILLKVLLRAALVCVWMAAASAQTTAPDFSIIVLPDTQYYSESYPSILNSQMQWIVKNAAALNVQAVLGVGDIVNDGSNVTQITAYSTFRPRGMCWGSAS